MHIQELIKDHPEYFPIFFLGMWMAGTTLLGILSGWFSVMLEFPDKAELARIRISNQSASMGLFVHLKGILTIEVCESGLRFKMMRIFGPFCQNFFIPYSALRISRKTMIVFPTTILSFGSFGKIRVSSMIGDQIAFAAKENWPEKNPPAPMTSQKLKWIYFSRWLYVTAFATTFFIVAPRIMTSNPAQRLPLWLAILFPPIPVALFTVISYFNETKSYPKPKSVSN